MRTKGAAKLIYALIIGATLLGAIACQQVTPEQIEGILQNVDSISGDVTIKLKDGSTITVKLQDVTVETLAQVAGSATLEPGSPVTVERDNNKNVKKLKTHAAEVEGIITSLNQTTTAVTIALDEGGEITLDVTEATKIEVEDEEDSAAFAALQVGQAVEAKYDVNTKIAVKIEVEEEEEAKDEVEGTITAIGAGTTTTVTIRAEDGTEVTYNVTPATKLKFDGVGTFANLKVGMKVEGKFNTATLDLIRLKVEAEKGKRGEAKGEVEGIITSLNQTTTTVTIRGKDGIEATYKVTPATKLELDGAGTFADLEVGMEVKAEFNRATKELRKLELED